MPTCQLKLANVSNSKHTAVGRESSVGIANCYGLGGPGIGSRWGGWDFPHLSRPARGLTQPPRRWIPVVEWSGCGNDHPPPPSAEVKKKIVELYLYSQSGRSWSVLGGTLPLPLHTPPGFSNCKLHNFYRRVKENCKNNIFETHAEFHLSVMKAQWHEGRGRILLGDSTCGGAVVLRPIAFHCFGVWISTGLRCITTDHMHNPTSANYTCAVRSGKLLRKSWRVCTAIC